MATYGETRPRQSSWNESEVAIKVGKSIFYLTLAIGLWFFYWLNGVQCPC